MADLNTVETAPALQALLEQGFVDLYRAANPTATIVTVRQDVNAPVATARRRVDYVLALPGAAFTAQVVSSRVVLNRPQQEADGRSLWPSDHYGIFAELTLVPRPP
jgi:exonuclease III